MNDSLSPPDASEGRVVSWSLIARVGLILAAFGIAGVCIHECGTIIEMKTYTQELIGGKPLPRVTQWVVNYRTGFLFAAFFIPGAALATFLQRDQGFAIGALTVLIVFGALHALFVHFALKLTLLAI